MFVQSHREEGDKKGKGGVIDVLGGEGGEEDPGSPQKEKSEGERRKRTAASFRGGGRGRNNLVIMSKKGIRRGERTCQ